MWKFGLCMKALMLAGGAFLISCGQDSLTEMPSSDNQVTTTSELETNLGEQLQTRSLLNNKLKTFTYDWYSRFDNGTTVDALAPNLVENGLEFIYPQGTFTSLEQMAPQFEANWKATESSAHEIEEVFVHETNEPDTYLILAPHTYLAQGLNGSFSEIDIIAAMKVITNEETALDPAGALPKIRSYRVVFERQATGDVSDRIDALRLGKLSGNDAKSFVHQWFGNLDAKDAKGVMNMTSNGTLNVNLLGTEIKDKASFEAYLNASSGAQNWATHQPHNIAVTKTEDGFSVRFLVRFKANIEGMGEIDMSNLTNWVLIEEDGELRLRDYSIELL